MTDIRVESKNKIDVEKKPRVYFTCHPSDFEPHFQKICNDIFKTHDCAVYYTEDMTAPIGEEERGLLLGRQSLFVVPVTRKLLTEPNRAMDRDVPYAIKEHIPVLPIMMESGLNRLYSKPDKFGELQYLNPFSTDATEISYEEKLKKHLEAILISDEVANRIRAAFDAYIFLSYRKVDRLYANELMRLIHANPEFRNVAVWFDEFLTIGESFKKNIERMLDDCQLFALLVTPNILERVVDEDGTEHDNYVISTELPLARKKKAEKGTEIFAVEMADTDRDALAAIHIGDCINQHDEAFRDRLSETLSGIATTSNQTPEHDFLIGLAYLDGIDVEVNREHAVALIASAAEAGLPEAMEKLYTMYEMGIGVALNYQTAAIWANAHSQSVIARFGEEHPNSLYSLNKLAMIYNKAGNYGKALELNEKLYALRCRLLGKEDPETLVSLHNLANTHSNLGNTQKALPLHEESYALHCKIHGEQHSRTLFSLNCLANTYDSLGDYQKALALKEKAYTLHCQIFGEEHPDMLVSLHNLAITYSNLKEHQKANALFEKAYALRCKILGEEHPDTLTTLNGLAATHLRLGDYQKARELGEKAYALHCKILGEEHVNTIAALQNLAATCRRAGDYETALEMSEKAYALFCNALGKEHAYTLNSLNNLANAYHSLGNDQKALELEEEAYAIRCRVFGKDHPATRAAFNSLTSTYAKLGERPNAPGSIESDPISPAQPHDEKIQKNHQKTTFLEKIKTWLNRKE